MINNATQQLVTVEAYFRRLQAVAAQLPFNDLEGIVDLLMEGFQSGRTVFVFGNGGSAATASHMMCDMNKGTIAEGEPRRFKVMALTDNVPLITAWANDSSYENIFAEQIRNFVRPGDIAFAISGSGNSPNVLLGLRAAREAGATAVGLAGYEGGKMKALCNVCAVVPCDNMQIIEDMHHAALHAMFTVIKGRVQLQMQRGLATGAGKLKK